VKAVLTVCSVDPALPDLLTRRGPLGHALTLALFKTESCSR